MRHKQPWKEQIIMTNGQFCCNAVTPRVIENGEIITLLLLLLLILFYAGYFQL
jgi:hypothetical protein